MSALPECVQRPVTYAYKSAFSFTESLSYYEHITAYDSSTAVDTQINLSHSFPSHLLFHNYFKNYRKKQVVENGWMRATIGMDRCEENISGCFRCPKLLMIKLLNENGSGKVLIPFATRTESSGTRNFSIPWDSSVSEFYVQSTMNSHIFSEYLCKRGDSV